MQIPTYRPGCRILNTAEFGFAGGLLHGLIAPTVYGGTCHLLPRWDPGRALRLLQERDIEILAVPVIFYEQMAAHPEFATARFPHLAAALTGAAPVTVSVLAAWREVGVVLRQGYGLTEAGSIVSYPSEDLALSHPESVGLGGILTSIRVLRENGQECTADEAGEIVVNGPGVARGYWRAPELTASAFRDGWFHTGDIGVIDAGGRLRIVGRLKDMIISGGMNIYAAELERVMGELPGVAEIAVIGVPDERFGETTAALIRRKPPLLTADDVLRHCRTSLASYKLPRYIEFISDPLPRTASGKLKKAEIYAANQDLPFRVNPVR